MTKKPNVFVHIESHYENNPISMVLKLVLKNFGAEPVEQLVNGDAEADIAITNSLIDALRMIKETEKTSIVIAYFKNSDGEEARALAERFPGRVSAAPYVGREGETDIAPFLLKMINEKTKEA